MDQKGFIFITLIEKGFYMEIIWYAYTNKPGISLNK